jgi:hypothetical protein
MMKRLTLGGMILLAGALFLSCAPVFADSISASNTNDGFGSSYILTAVCTGNLRTVTLSIDTTWVGVSYADVSNVDFKIGTTESLTGTLTDPTANWQQLPFLSEVVAALEATTTVRSARSHRAISQMPGRN